MVSLDEMMRTIEQANGPEVLKLPQFQNTPTVREYLSKLMRDKNVSQKELRQALLLERTHAYQLFNGIRVPTRRQILCMSIYMRLSLTEAQTLLNIAQRGELYPRKHFDAVILYALIRKMTLEQTDDLLVNSGERALFER